jgi:glycosyltransferase involved in cell wall biosynthesis
VQVHYVIGNAYAGGGTIRTTLSMAGALAARGHEVEVVSVRRNRQLPVFPVPEGVLLTPLTSRLPLPPSHSPTHLARRTTRAAFERPRSRLIHPADRRYASFSLATDLALWRYLRGVRVGVVIGTRPGLNLAVARWCRQEVIRVGQEHLYLARTGPELRSAYRERYGGLDAVVTLTEQDAEDYRALLGDRVRVLAIPNAVPDLHGARACPDAANTVAVAAGRLTRQKGFDLLIKAWQGVAAAHPDWMLDIYGEGNQRSKLQHQIDTADLQRQVHLRGFTPNLHEELARASLYVLSSRFEGFPMVLLEAMGCGLPSVTFDCPTGPSSLIDEGVNGLLVRPRSVAGLTTAVNHAIEHPALRARLGASAHLTASAYARAAIAARWESLFRDLGRRVAR